jgi:hypothetical protein
MIMINSVLPFGITYYGQEEQHRSIAIGREFFAIAMAMWPCMVYGVLAAEVLRWQVAELAF